MILSTMTSKMKAALLWVTAVAALVLGLTAILRSSIFAGSSDLHGSLAIITQGFGTFLLFSLFVGITAMSLLEAAKALLFLRGFFYQAQVPRLANISKHDLSFILSTNRPGRNLLAPRLDMPVGQLAAQLASRIDAGINDLGRQIDAQATWLDRLPELDTSNAIENEYDDIEPHKPNWLLSRLLGQKFREYEQKLNSRRLSEAESVALIVELRETAEIRLDALQVTLRANWRWFMRFTVSVLSAIIAVMVTPYTGIYDAILVAGSSFLVAGFMATAIYDVFSILRPAARS